MKARYPLYRHTRIRTRRSDELERGLGRVYAATLHELPDPSSLNVCASFVELADIALGFARSGTRLTVHFDETDYARLQTPLRGKGSTTIGTRSVPVSPGRPCVVSYGHCSKATYGADLENLFLRVRSEALDNRLALLIGRPLSGKLEFVPDEFVSPEMLSGLRRIVGLLVQQLDDERSLISPHALKELEEAAIVQLLCTAKHNLSHLLEREPLDTSPAVVRRVEAYIESNWHIPITIEALAGVSGVSARTLFRTFKRTRGSSPMTFLRQTRLKQAHSLLSRPDHRTSVTGVALACGFSNPGQFAREYRECFGELPSFTLQKHQPK